MEQAFWQQCWNNNQIGFHLSTPHPLLQQHWQTVKAEPGQRVLVPFCGKTLDLLWLAEQGLEVIGAELSELAVDSFFREHQLQPIIKQQGELRHYQHGNITIFCGDFFALTPELTGQLDYFYDRAALGALPAEMREAYVAQIQSLMQHRGRGLYISHDYNQDEMAGPPFSVPPAVSAELYGKQAIFHLLASMDALPNNKGLAERGLTAFTEHALLIELS